MLAPDLVVNVALDATTPTFIQNTDLDYAGRQIARHGHHTKDPHRHSRHLSHNFRRSFWPTAPITKDTNRLAAESAMPTYPKHDQSDRSEDDGR